jgi:hypothetical protein
VALEIGAQCRARAVAGRGKWRFFLWATQTQERGMTTQLRCRDLRPGDIMLKVSDGSAVSGAIQLGQRLVGGANPQVVHAGVMFDSTYIVEAQGAGIIANDLRVQDQRYGYHVFRCTNSSMAAGAGTCAKLMFDIHARGKNLGYSVPGAVGSLFGRGRAASRDQMDDLLDRILAGRGQRFFCSQFVVFVYQFVAEQNGMSASAMFNLSDAKASPSTLASALSGRALFTEAGYVMPNAR